MAEVFTSLLLIVAVAFVAPLISWTIPKRLVPEVVLLILGGMLIGPHGLGLAAEDSSIELLRELGVAFLFLMAGYEIDINELRGAGGRHAAVAWLLSLGLAFGAVSVIGVRAIEMQLACSGNSFFAIIDHAGQQEVAMNGSFSGTSLTKSSASCAAHRSAPMATSIISAKPRRFIAARSLPGVIFGPNWPTNAGATAA